MDLLTDNCIQKGLLNEQMGVLLSIFHDSVELLLDLKSKNFLCYVLSNWSAETFVGMKDDYPFLNKFDGLLLSGEVKLIKPEIAIYTDGDVDNANRYLIKSGLLKKPYFWVILPSLPGCSPMHNPSQMISGLTRIVNTIKDIDSDSIISVCAAGRASLYLVTLAAIMGLHLRVGMEDTVWEYPHKDNLIKSNTDVFVRIRNICNSLGREVMSSKDFKNLIK